jgi:deoxyadenosine/deoxycytidine kinase
MDPVIVSIEGNIGVGKSTLINILKDNFENCEVVDEPVDMWTKITDSSNNKNILELFYDDPEKWSYYFQHVACITRMIKIEEVLKKTNKNIIFLDRSLETDCNIFEKMLYDNKQITEIEHKMYKLLYNFYQDYVRSNSRNIIVYLKSNPETCMKRIQKRNRQGEDKITLEYLQNLNKYNDDCLLNNDNKNIIIIDCNEEFENNGIKIQKFINDI